MNRIIEPDTVTIVRKKGDDLELAKIPTRKTLRGSKLSAGQAREITIAQLEKDPNVILIMHGDDEHCVAKASLSDDVELTMTINTGSNPEGRVEITSAKDENSSAGAFFTIFGNDGEQDEVIEHTLDCMMGLLGQYDQSTKKEKLSTESPYPHIFIPEARETMEDACMQVEGFLAADVDFEPFMFVHEDEVLLLGSEHFNGYDLFIEAKRLFIGATLAQKQETANKAEQDNDVSAIRCADESWSFRKPLNITSEESFIDELNTAVNELKQAIVQVGEEPEGEARMEVQRQLFTWEVLDAVVKYKKLPM